jgi:hypothetical protein
MNKTLLAMSIAASLAVAASPAFALVASTDAVDVTIQEGAITGAGTNVVVADQLSGQYDEIFTVTDVTTSSFNTLAVFNAGGWFNNNVAAGDQINVAENIALGIGYGLYALFQSDGTFSVSGTSVVFSGGNGTLQLWADPLQNTTKQLPGTVLSTDTISAILLGNTGDDQLLGSASLLTYGDGSGSTGAGSNGNFELIFGDWLLNGVGADGDAYFTAPRPFMMMLDLNGNFQEFNPASIVDVKTNGSANAFFAVPEPGTTALLGLGLLGMGLGLRRRKA